MEKEFTKQEFKIFELFKNNWALVTAGGLDKYNSCTIGWGSFGTLWTRNGKGGNIVTIYIHPARYTFNFLKENDYFTISFFDEKYKSALSYIGSHSGKNENKTIGAKLQPIEVLNGVSYKEACMTLVCRKLYSRQFAKEDLVEDVKQYYISKPQSYPLDENGIWQTHYEFIGEIIEVI